MSFFGPLDPYWGGDLPEPTPPPPDRDSDPQEITQRVRNAISMIIRAATAGDEKAQEICLNETQNVAWVETLRPVKKSLTTPAQFARKVSIATNIIIRAAKTGHEEARKICQTEGWKWE